MLFKHNLTISFGKFVSEPVTMDNFSILISSSEDMMKPWFLEHPNWFKILHCSYEGCMILIGTCFRFIVYKHWFKTFQRKEITDIDKLLIPLVSTQHLNMLVYFFSFVLKVTTEVSDIEALGNIVGTVFCNFHIFLHRFDALYKYIGGFGIALYRILLIASPNLVECRIGKNRLFYLVLHVGFITTFCSTASLYFDDYNQVFMNNCIDGAPKRMLLEILDEHELSQGNKSIHSFCVSVRMYLGILDMFCVMCTMTIYIMFFRIAYKHDNNENLKKLLEPEVIRKRNQRNSITFFGLFCSFVLQMIVVTLFMIQVALGTPENQLFDIFLMLRTTLFTGMAVIEVVTSKNLRTQLLRKKNI